MCYVGNIKGYVCRDDTAWTKTIPKDTTEEVGVNLTESSGDADSGV